MTDVVVVAGLGNPGREYLLSRHNMGFMVVDGLAAVHSLSFQGSRFQAQVAKGRIDGTQVLLVKPQTYMNRSGQAVGPLVRYHRLPPERLLVVHDDLDMELGRLKFARGGGHGGHNGVRSVMEALGTRSFPRLKLGIGRPLPGQPVDKYVLSRFSSEEMEVVEEVLAAAVRGVETFIGQGIESAMNGFNGLKVGGG